MFTATYGNLETLPPAIDTNPSHINPGGNIPAWFSDTPWAGGTTIVIGSLLTWSAGLSKRFVTTPPGLLPAISKIAFSYQIRLSQDAARYSDGQENDLMITDSAANLYNGSCRKLGGLWQVVNAAGAWVSTGFDPGPFAPDEWTAVTVNYLLNWATKTIAVLSIEDIGVLFTIPSPFAKASTPNSGWAPSIIDWQAQETVGAVPGAFSRDTRNVGVVLS